jgi:hypothetical protein
MSYQLSGRYKIWLNAGTAGVSHSTYFYEVKICWVQPISRKDFQRTSSDVGSWRD